MTPQEIKQILIIEKIKKINKKNRKKSKHERKRQFLNQQEEQQVEGFKKVNDVIFESNNTNNINQLPKQREREEKKIELMFSLTDTLSSSEDRKNQSGITSVQHFFESPEEEDADNNSPAEQEDCSSCSSLSVELQISSSLQTTPVNHSPVFPLSREGSPEVSIITKNLPSEVLHSERGIDNERNFVLEKLVDKQSPVVSISPTIVTVKQEPHSLLISLPSSPQQLVDIILRSRFFTRPPQHLYLGFIPQYKKAKKLFRIFVKLYLGRETRWYE
jgi:hypothetical protein